MKSQVVSPRPSFQQHYQKKQIQNSNVYALKKFIRKSQQSLNERRRETQKSKSSCRLQQENQFFLGGELKHQRIPKYDGLNDRYLLDYFSNQSKQQHLQSMGLLEINQGDKYERILKRSNLFDNEFQKKCQLYIDRYLPENSFSQRNIQKIPADQQVRGEYKQIQNQRYNERVASENESNIELPQIQPQKKQSTAGNKEETYEEQSQINKNAISYSNAEVHRDQYNSSDSNINNNNNNNKKVNYNKQQKSKYIVIRQQQPQLQPQAKEQRLQINKPTENSQENMIDKEKKGEISQQNSNASSIKQAEKIYNTQKTPKQFIVTKKFSSINNSNNNIFPKCPYKKQAGKMKMYFNMPKLPQQQLSNQDLNQVIAKFRNKYNLQDNKKQLISGEESQGNKQLLTNLNNSSGASIPLTCGRSQDVQYQSINPNQTQSEQQNETHPSENYLSLKQDDGNQKQGIINISDSNALKNQLNPQVEQNQITSSSEQNKEKKNQEHTSQMIQQKQESMPEQAQKTVESKQLLKEEEIQENISAMQNKLFNQSQNAQENQESLSKKK